MTYRNEHPVFIYLCTLALDGAGDEDLQVGEDDLTGGGEDLDE